MFLSSERFGVFVVGGNSGISRLPRQHSRLHFLFSFVRFGFLGSVYPQRERSINHGRNRLAEMVYFTGQAAFTQMRKKGFYTKDE